MKIDKDGVLISFFDRPTVTDLRIPEGVSAIAPRAFYGSEHLRNVYIPESCMEIGEEAFRGCRSLETADTRSRKCRLGDGVFRDCPQLYLLTLPSELERIPDHAFEGCTSLYDVIVPSSVNSVGEAAFRGCRELKTVCFFKMPEHFGDEVFGGCSSLRELELARKITLNIFDAMKCLGPEHMRFRGLDLYFGEDICKLDHMVDIEPAELMLETHSYSLPMKKELKYPYILAQYAKTRDRKAGEYIKRNFSRFFDFAVRSGNLPAVTAAAEEKLIPLRSVGRFIELASECGQHEIYLTLVNYKDMMGGYKERNGAKRFAL